MKDKMRNAIANVELEGCEFSVEQIKFISDLVERIDSGEIDWSEAIEIIKVRHEKG